MAFTTGNQVLPGYEMSIGDKLLVAFDHTGPASYVQFVSPTTGGEVIQAASGGLNRGGFDRLQMGTDTTGQISAVVIPSLGGYGNAMPSVIVQYNSLVSATLGGQMQTAGTQIVAGTNLTTFAWRCEAVMI